MKESEKIFISRKFVDCHNSYALGMKISCEENPELTLDEVLEKVKKTATEEHLQNINKAANFLRINAKRLGIKLA